MTATLERTCECGCGAPVRNRFVSGHNVRTDPVSRHRTHGLSETPEHQAWAAMKYRCLNPDSPAYHNYGGRGITVCDEWRDSFEAFFEHIGPRPGPQYSLDRINNEGNYEPGNVRWALPKAQTQNRRTMFICKRGHKLTSENVGITKKGRRFCRECARMSYRRYQAKKEVNRCACGCGGLTAGTWMRGHNHKGR